MLSVKVLQDRGSGKEPKEPREQRHGSSVPQQFFTHVRLGRLVCFVPPFISFLGLCVLIVRRARDAPDKVRRPDMFRAPSLDNIVQPCENVSVCVC